jgi:hypothetical protein
VARSSLAPAGVLCCRHTLSPSRCARRSRDMSRAERAHPGSRQDCDTAVPRRQSEGQSARSATDARLLIRTIALASLGECCTPVRRQRELREARQFRQPTLSPGPTHCAVSASLTSVRSRRGRRTVEAMPAVTCSGRSPPPSRLALQFAYTMVRSMTRRPFGSCQCDTED